jgi:hypothetical protein
VLCPLKHSLPSVKVESPPGTHEVGGVVEGAGGGVVGESGVGEGGVGCKERRIMKKICY